MYDRNATAEVVWEMTIPGDHGWVLSRSVAILGMQGGAECF